MTKMTRRKRVGCNSDLPMELVNEVLVRLPIKTLLRFRCVCKSWNSLICSPAFASLHLNRCREGGNSENTFVLTATHRFSTLWMLRSTHNFKKVVSRYCRNLSHLSDPDFTEHGRYYPHGTSVNGLLFLLNNITNEPSMPHLKELILWNPVAGKTHTLPPLSIGATIIGLGLGHSLSNNDYKVVVFSRVPHPTVHVYTLSTHIWRCVEDYQGIIIDEVEQDGVFIEGTIYWVTKKEEDGSWYMVSFDVENEVFDCIALPSYDIDYRRRHLVAYRGQVGLLDKCWPFYNLWVMEPDKEARAWSKLYTVDWQELLYHSILCFKKTGQLIVATERGIVEVDFETQRRKHLCNNRSSSYWWNHYCTLYEATLVLLQN